MSSYEEAIHQLNNLQSNFQVLAAQRKGRNERDHPKTIFENHKGVLRNIQNGQLEQKLGQIPLVHIAGTKVVLIWYKLYQGVFWSDTVFIWSIESSISLVQLELYDHFQK